MRRRVSLILVQLVGLAQAAAPAGAERLTIVGLEKIPAGPRAAYEAYLRHVAERKLDAALACLHDAFLAPEGGKAERKKRLEWRWRSYDDESITVEVERAEGARSYTRPRTVRAPEKTWAGELCLIASRTITVLVHPGTKAKVTQKTPLVQTVLKKEGGKWLIVSEHASTRNAKAVALAVDLTARLKKALGKTKLWDGEKELVALEVVKARLPKVQGLARWSWEPIGVAMTGPDRDAPHIKGNVTVESLDAAPGAKPLCYEVVLLMLMEKDRDRLRLVGIEFKAVEYEPPEKEPEPEDEKEPQKEDEDDDE